LQASEGVHHGEVGRAEIVGIDHDDGCSILGGHAT